MNARNIGRNDPCPCGSGKKYKRCHWDEHQRQPLPVVTTNPSARHGMDRIPPEIDLELMRRNLKLIQRDRSDSTTNRLLETTERLIVYRRHLPAIEDACATLTEHEAEFDALWNDDNAFMKRVHEVFGDERFEGLRFQAADVQRAFEKVGFPGLMTDPKTFDVVQKAILHLANENWRIKAGVELLMTLPDYVQARQFTDGLLVQSCAEMTTNDKDQSNAFIFEMFLHGMTAWENQRDHATKQLMSQVGVDADKFRSLSPAESEAEIARLQADPETQKLVNAYMTAHPETVAAMRAQDESVRELSIALLDRDDTASLLPSADECMPWLEEFSERVMNDSVLSESLSQNQGPTEESGGRLGDILFDVSEKMATVIFTPERIAQLKSQIHGLAAQYKSAGDQKGVDQANAAIIVLARDIDHPVPHFLMSICYTALRNILMTIDPAAPET